MYLRWDPAQVAGGSSELHVIDLLFYFVFYIQQFSSVLLTLHLGFNPGGRRGSYGMLGDQMKVSCMQDEHITRCSVSSVLICSFKCQA